jgi:peptide deformylase
MIDIVTNVASLQTPYGRVDSLDEAKIIADRLFATLSRYPAGVGLAANQIGIVKAVCVVNVSRPLWFANPTFTYYNTPEKTVFQEGCISFPDVTVLTERYKNIIVQADNFLQCNEMIFDEKNILECVCVQHEICHLMGETMFDYRSKPELI